ncbi:hypothetical protein CI109_106177 [Kwoniella shandongensis]|uniref:Uncharacterized protein n=1 Tax=Kwoniella shandongensis TaxID=1734106 RepID=A0AAJ8LN95_9TREE
MFEILEDPPSRSTSPFKTIDDTNDVSLEKALEEAWKRARNGSGHRGDERDGARFQTETASTSSTSSRGQHDHRNLERGDRARRQMKRSHNANGANSETHSPTTSAQGGLKHGESQYQSETV